MTPIETILKMHLQDVGFQMPAIGLLLADVQMAGCQLSGRDAALRTGPVFMPSLRPAFLFPAAHRFDAPANSLHSDAKDLTPSARRFGATLVSAPPPAAPPRHLHLRAQASVLLGTKHRPVCVIMCVIVWTEETRRLGLATVASYQALSGSS